jgi:hypothetical protein
MLANTEEQKQSIAALVGILHTSLLEIEAPLNVYYCSVKFSILV